MYAYKFLFNQAFFFPLFLFLTRSRRCPHRAHDIMYAYKFLFNQAFFFLLVLGLTDCAGVLTERTTQGWHTFSLSLWRPQPVRSCGILPARSGILIERMTQDTQKTLFIPTLLTHSGPTSFFPARSGVLAGTLLITFHFNQIKTKPR